MNQKHLSLSAPRTLTLIALVLLVALARLLPHPPNFSPVAALALFAGAHFSRRWLALTIPLAAMFISDLALGLHSFIGVVYGSFALTVLLGGLLRERRRPLPITLGALSASLLFFILTNFAVWSMGGFYPPTSEGLVACYVAALPFFQQTLMGNLLYSGLFFGAFALLERQVPALRPVTG